LNQISIDVSTASCVTSGVSQGSVLGPLLFLLFINDLADELGNFLTVQLFADDVKIYTVIIDEDSKIASLQDGFDNSVPGLLNGR